jgi:hypothetical protein
VARVSGARDSSVTMQSEHCPALTLSLSPGRGDQLLPLWKNSRYGGASAAMENGLPLHEPPVAQVGNLLYRRLAVGWLQKPSRALRITNPRYSRLPVCATVQGFNARNLVSANSLLGGEDRAFAAPKWLRPRRRGEGERFPLLNGSGL